MSPRRGHAGADPRRGREGYALVMVLFFLLAVAAMLAPLVLGARTDFLVASNKLRQDRFDLLAEGVLVALARQLSSPAIDEPPSGFRTRSTPMACALGGWRIEARVQDQRGLIDLNTASPEMIEAGFAALGFEGGAAGKLRDAVVAFRLTPEAAGERPKVEADFVTGGLKEGPFEAVEELYDFRPVRRLPVRALAETFTLHNQQETILGPELSQRLARVLPAAPSQRYPFVLAEAGENGSPRTYRIDVAVQTEDSGITGYAGAVILSNENDFGDFQFVERVTNPAVLPDKSDFRAAVECDKLFGDGVAAALAAAAGQSGGQ